MNGFRLGRALSIAGKEVRHILRDPFTLTLALGLPVIMVTFFGFAIDLDVRDVGIVVTDSDKSRASRQLVELLESSAYFKVRQTQRTGRPLSELDAERAKAMLLIEPNFGKDIDSGAPAKIQIVLDGADNSTASTIMGYLTGLQTAAETRLIRPPRPPVELETRFLFNPELNSHWFIVPGLSVIIVGLVAILLTALTVAREWENGSMELLLSTPIQPIEIILGKLAPYVGLGLAGAAFVYLVARMVFGVPFRGSHVLFIAATLMYLAATLSQGLFISVATRQQQLAMQFSIISGLLPSILLSGFVFPIENMPIFFRYFTAILAPRWYMKVIRGIFLKGAGPAALVVPMAALACISTVLILIAAKRFKKDLEP